MTASNEQVTLQKGDYIATADLSEDDYHNVARAFMAAGAVDRGEAQWEKNEYDKDLRKLGWDCRDNELWSSSSAVAGFTRQLTLSQILNATNAGSQPTEPTTETTPMHLADRLEAAIRAASEANAEVERLQAEWRAEYPNISGCVDIDVEDIKPEDWKAGDIVECIDDMSTGNTIGYFTTGKRYEVVKNDGSISFKYSSNEAESHYAYNKCFKFIRRP